MIKVGGSKFIVVKNVRLLFYLSLFTFSSSFLTYGQELSMTEIAPPPLKIISKGEKEQLEAEKDIKDRTKLAMVFMEGRIAKAEAFDKEDKFLEMYEELGKFHALMDYTLNYLNRNDDGSRKVLGNFKRFEIGIRAYAPRLENVRRRLPIRYEPYVKSLLEQIRDTRGKAVEAFFDDSVVPQATNKP